MSEGPQVHLRTAWLGEQLAGRVVRDARTTREDLQSVASRLAGRRAQRVFCKGKHIFVAFDGGIILHNHMLMRGGWRREPGPMLLLPPEVWLALEVGQATIVNTNGQMLRAESPEEVEAALASLGPDVCDQPFPHAAVVEALSHDGRPVGETIMDQGVISGVGNVLKSESLLLAGVDPRTPTAELGRGRLDKLARSIAYEVAETFKRGGRMSHRVYQRANQRCDSCGSYIKRIKQDGRSTYFCPACQCD
jgi:formamidopyrimidine-DNA glycosylase